MALIPQLAINWSTAFRALLQLIGAQNIARTFAAKYYIIAFHNVYEFSWISTKSTCDQSQIQYNLVIAMAVYNDRSGYSETFDKSQFTVFPPIKG